MRTTSTQQNEGFRQAIGPTERQGTDMLRIERYYNALIINNRQGLPSINEASKDLRHSADARLTGRIL